MTTPGPILPGPGFTGILPPGATPGPLLPATSPAPVVVEDFNVLDIYTDAYHNLYGVAVLLTTVQLLPPTSP